MNTIRLKLFPFSLKDKAKTWLQNLRPGSIRAWDEMQQQFLNKFFSVPQNKLFQKINHHFHSKTRRNILPMLG
jgi:hypothetical protein